MANFQKLKTRNKLGTPPAETSTSNNLTAPETAPLTPKPISEGQTDQSPVDGRTLRATGRTEPFSTRVSPGVRKRYKTTAARDDITMGELLERALEAYEKLQEN